MSNEVNKTEKTSTKDGACKLVFKSYYVDTVEFKHNKEYKPDEGVPIEFEMASDIEFINDGQVKVKLLLSIFDDATANNKPFEMKLTVVGIFSIRNYEKEDSVLLEQNTLSILFPFARAIVSTYTASANVAPLILPPINIIEYMKDKQEARNNRNIMK